MTLTILHTNDAHGRWKMPFVEKLRQLREQHAALLLDAGDCLRTGNIAIPMKPPAEWDYIRQAGYDAITIGNREFHILPKGFLAKVQGAPCPLLCANIRPKHPDTPLPVQSVWRGERAGVQIGIVGLTIPMVTPRMQSARLSAYLFDPPLTVAREWATRLRPQVDLLIALTHLGIDQDRKLAAACPEFDLIIGGHSHTPLERPERIGTVWVAQAKPFARGIGVLHLTRTPDGWHIEGEIANMQK
ncbi:Trifunctional nucleotide phosphoesterase protein YfkN [bacterium HR15]|nr:Trifunctional nucleotide phosphoesterase protein YfkN [bacterium HR15]